MAIDVLVVGAGPVGLMNALILAKAGVSVTVLEAENGIVESPRAMVYAWCVLEGLALYGLLDDMKVAGFINAGRGYRVLATGEQIIHDYDAIRDQARHPYALTLGQNRLAEVLLQHLKRYPGVDIRWGTRFTGLTQHPDFARVAAETEAGPLAIDAKWVIAADGGRSGVRKALGLAYDGMTWPDRFVATNIYYDFNKYGWASGYLIDSAFGAVVSKITRDGLWRVTFSEDATLPMTSLRERIDAYMQIILPGDKHYELTLFSGYNMHQRTASTYRVGRVVLAGDAAHVTNPTSGLGLVGGMYDSFALAEALAAVLYGDAGDEVLDRYAEARRKVYLDVTSPVSTDSMRLVFHSAGAQLEQALARLRAMKADLGLMRKALMKLRALETPSLITGLTLAEACERQR